MNDPDVTLRRLLRQARQVADAEGAHISTTDPAGYLVVKAVSGRGLQRFKDRRYPVAGSLAGEAVAGSRHLISTNARRRAHPSEPFGGEGPWGPVAYLPLVHGPTTYGALGVGRIAEKTALGNRQLRLLEPIAIAAAGSFCESHLSTDVRPHLIRDRERIARELHDGSIQALFALGMNLESLVLGGQLPDEAKDRLERALRSVTQTIQDMRTYIFGLHPGLVPHLEVSRILEAVGQEYADGIEVEVNVEIKEATAAKMAGKLVSIVQVVREGLSNAVRHSGARRVDVGVRETPRNVVVEILDDGRGYQLDGDPKAGRGTANLRERARELGGRIEVLSREGWGTQLRLLVPKTRGSEEK